MNYQLYKHMKDNIYSFEKQKRIDIENITFKTEEEKYKYIFVEYNSKNCIVTNESMNLAFPILENGKLREMTREEKILLLGHIICLVDGEYIENNQIKMIEKPKNKYLNYAWDKEAKTWKFIETKEAILLARKNLILEYKKIKEEIETLEEFEEEFESTETIKLLKQKQAETKAEINELTKLIKTI